MRIAIIAFLVCLFSVPVMAVQPRRHVRTESGRFPICPGYELKAPKPIVFNSNEKKLICGDPDAASWEDIPRFQAEYFLEVFLQDRGYFFPTFTTDGDIVVVDPGPVKHVEQIEISGSPPEFFDVTRRRKIKGSLLTPDILSTLESWTKSEMRTNGYPCPKITSTADAGTGVVRLDVDPGPFQTIAEVIEEQVNGLRPGTLERYRAFNIGDPYDARNLSITKTRIETLDGILQSSYFLTECTDRGAVLTQKSMAGPPRLLRIGVGVSTEDYVIGKLTIKWARAALSHALASESVRHHAKMGSEPI